MSDYVREPAAQRSSLFRSAVRPGVETSARAGLQAARTPQSASNQAAQLFSPVCPAHLPAPTACPFGGICHACPARVQAKLMVSEPEDRGEQEADRVAEQVMRMPSPCASCGDDERIQPKLISSAVGPVLQRQAAPEDEEEEKPVQTKRKEGFASTPAQSAEGLLQESSGNPLPTTEREFFEPRFGIDLNRVRVHTDPASSEVAEAMAARAFTSGSHVVFGSGEFAPGTSEGRRLLAHELVHVVQQGQARSIDSPTLQRQVDDRRVSCRTTGLTGGVPGGNMTGQDVIAAIRESVDRAVDLGRRAENLLFLQRLTYGTGAYSADADLDAALLRRFGPTLANPRHHRTIEILEREFKSVTDYLASGAPFYVCRGSQCDADTWAYALVPGRTIHFCNSFYSAASLNLKGSTVLHEAFHLWWDQVNDQGNRPLHNAHCFEQFALDLAGATAEIPADFANACVV